MCTQLEQVQNRLNNFKLELVKEDARKEAYVSQLNTKIAECANLDEVNKVLVAALRLLEQCDISARNFVKTEVEQLVTQGLRSIFENPSIKFNIDFVSKRNQIEAEFTLSKEKEGTCIQGDILSTYGGGVADVISFSLRIIIMRLLKIKGPLILDEPGKMISAQFIGAFGRFLTEVSTAFDQQIIMITHTDKLIEFANNTIEVRQVKGVSYIV